MDSNIEVKEMPAYHVAYVRHVGPYYKIGEAFGRLAAWAGAKGLIGPGAAFMGIYHDDPNAVAAEKLRSDACMVVPENTEVEGDVQISDIPAGLYAVLRGEVQAQDIGTLWMELGEWLGRSDYVSDNRPCYELYLNDHETHPEKKFILDICEPVKPR